LLAYLRANGFQIWIVSGGGIECMRVFAASRSLSAKECLNKFGDTSPHPYE